MTKNFAHTYLIRKTRQELFLGPISQKLEGVAFKKGQLVQEAEGRRRFSHVAGGGDSEVPSGRREKSVSPALDGARVYPKPEKK